jgi:FkbM family methyltransferase
MALRARGYNNCGDLRSSGEAILIRRVAEENPTLCVDVGANKGGYSRALLENTNATVIAFEPLPKAFTALVALAEGYGSRLLAVNKGVGDKDAELELFYGEEDSEWASFSSDVNAVGYVGASNKNTMKIPVTTLDTYFAAEGRKYVQQGIDLLKIDTEGYEYNVLLGARHTISSIRPKFVQIEFNWHQLFRAQSLHSLASLLPGYQAYQLLPHGKGLNKVDPAWPESNIYHFSNFVFVRNDVTI